MTQMRHLREGDGWRVGWDGSAHPFCGLLGGQGWAIELTAEEFQDFRRLSLQLADAMQQMAAELMDEERIACEAESDRLWLEAEGYPQAYELALMLQDGRRAEGRWPASVVPHLMHAMQTLDLF